MNKIYYSKISDPESFPESKSLYTPIWIQPIIFWILEKVFKQKVARYRYGKRI